MHHPARVILCGPFPAPGRIGGYARCNELIEGSFLGSRFGIERLPVTGSGEGSLLGRLGRDVIATRAMLLRCPAPVFHLTAQYQRGTYREFLQYQLALRHGRSFLLDIRGGCLRACYERPASIVRRELLARMIRGAAAISAEGRPDVAWLERDFDRDVTWLPNFVPASDRTSLKRAQLHAPDRPTPLRLAYSGRLSPEKGVLALLEAGARVARLGIRCRVELIGRGEPAFEETLRSRTESLPNGAKVTFHGHLPRERLMRVLAECHIFVFPSRWFGEGHSNAVNEAMQVGLPVICSNQGFLGDVVTPACGVVLDRADAGSIAEAIEALVADWNRLRAMGQAATDRIYEHFSDERVLPALSSLYDGLIEERDD